MSRLSSRYRRAFVTGASRGIGHAFAAMLLSEGVKVWGTARETSRLGTLGEHENFKPVSLDLADGEEAARVLGQAAAEAGGFDLVVNNAGYGYFGRFDHEDFSVWKGQVDAMLLTTMMLARAAVCDMRARKRGVLVNVSSLAAEFPLPFMSGYNVAKAGLSALSESLMVETSGSGVSVIDFRPGDYRTGFNQAMSRPEQTAVAAEPRMTRAWLALETKLLAAPAPEKAARDLRDALRRPRSGVVRSGSFFQARLAPLLARFAPLSWRRAVSARYFNVA